MPPRLRLVGAHAPSRSGASPSGSIRVVLANDHPAMRHNLRALLDSEDGLEVVGEATDLAAVGRHVDGQGPHVLVLNLRTPRGSAIETIRRLRRQAPDSQLVLMTMSDNPVFARHALDAGAIGFVMTEMADSDLPAAIRDAAAGKQYVSPRLCARASSPARTGPRVKPS
jgi:two-component system, NarL family, response regulator NreC